jgi:type I restriction enzyme S subunit
MKAVVEKTEADAIPDDWETVPLGEVGTWLSGGTPSKSKESYWTGDIPWVSPKDMKQARLTDATDHISGEALGNGGKLAPKHAILIVVRGMILAHTFPVARIEREMAFNQDIKAVDTHDFIDSGFLLWWLRNHSREFLKTATSASHGSKRISTESLFSQPIPVPPREEQEAIAEALSDVDALLASIDAAIEKKRNVRTATMQRLLTGEERLPGFEGEWERKPLESCLADPPRYGVNAPAVPYNDSLPTYIRITDITEDGRYSPDSRVSVDVSDPEEYQLDQGDLVFARTGASVGKSYLYDESDGELVYAGFLIRIRPDPGKLDPEFLAYYAKTQRYWKWIRSMSMRSGQPGVNGKQYSQLPVPLPSIPEQRAIAEVLSDMDAEIEAWETRRAKTEAVKTGMMQELLTGKTRLT